MILLAVWYTRWEACWWQEYSIKPPEVRHYVEAYIWRLTSLLVVTLPKLKLKPAAFSDACESYSFLCNASRHFEESHLVVKMQTSHCQSEHSGRSGLVWTPDPSGPARKGLGNNPTRKCLHVGMRPWVLIRENGCVNCEYRSMSGSLRDDWRWQLSQRRSTLRSTTPWILLV